MKSIGPSEFILPVSKTEMKQILDDHEFWDNCRQTFEDLRYENKSLYLMHGDDTLKIMREWKEKSEKYDNLYIPIKPSFEDLQKENKKLKEELE